MRIVPLLVGLVAARAALMMFLAGPEGLTNTRHNLSVLILLASAAALFVVSIARFKTP